VICDKVAEMRCMPLSVRMAMMLVEMEASTATNSIAPVSTSRAHSTSWWRSRWETPT